MVIETNIPNLDYHNQKYSHIMEKYQSIIAMKRTCWPEYIVNLSQKKCLSDLATGDRKSISPIFWIGNINPMADQYHWPLQPMPRQKAQKNWKSALQSTHYSSRYLSVPDYQSFWHWPPSDNSAGWVFSPSQEHIFHLYNQGWSAYHPLTNQQVR